MDTAGNQNNMEVSPAETASATIPACGGLLCFGRSAMAKSSVYEAFPVGINNRGNQRPKTAKGQSVVYPPLKINNEGRNYAIEEISHPSLPKAPNQQWFFIIVVVSYRYIPQTFGTVSLAALIMLLVLLKPGNQRDFCICKCY